MIRTSLLLLLLSSPAFAQTAENVLLVLNGASAASLDIGSYYAQKRGIPESNILKLRTGTGETIPREDFGPQIETPIASRLLQNAAQDRILYIVLTRGVPLRIAGTSGPEGTVASVDSELTLLYRRMLGFSLPAAGMIRNPYFLGDAPIGKARPFLHSDHDIYLVSRLDGYTVAEVRGLIDRGFAPSREGRILLDSRGSSTEKADGWLLEAAERIGSIGFKDRVVHDRSKRVLREEKGVLGYYSWGSNDPAIRTRQFDFEFVPGALAGMYVSSDGRTFRESARPWTISESGSPQSLAADLIREGVTGIAAHVAEPFLEATIRPDILFPAYLSGFSLVESFYLAMPYLSWQTVVVGDPLCAPFREKPLPAGAIDRGIDPETEFPADFGPRRAKALEQAAAKTPGIEPAVFKMMARAQALLARRDQAGARRALEQAIAIDDRLPEPNLTLAGMYEAGREYDKAIERYRRVHELAPDNLVVLNNLAYALAVRKNRVQEAIPLAEKAYNLGGKVPNIADTLGWIYHLAGQSAKAVQLLREAAKGAPRNAEIHLHLAIAAEATGDGETARTALRQALKIDPSFAKREEVRELQSAVGSR